jgi:hypothetical protein
MRTSNERTALAGGRALRFVAGTLITGVLAGCAITSPHWDYVPASISTPIPFQAWNSSTGPLYVECANDTGAHGSPSAGEASYIAAATLTTSALPSLDSAGNAIHSASKQVTLPRACWKYFGSYDFWQANVRVVRLQDGKKVPLSTYDLKGLECVGRENGKVGRWYGFVGKGCEKKYLGTSTAIPYIVMRINGYNNGLKPSVPAPPVRPGALPAHPVPPRPGIVLPPSNSVPNGTPRAADVPPITPTAIGQAAKGGLR